MRRVVAVRRSRAAWWSRLAGALALPVLVVTAGGARLGLVPENALVPSIALGFALAVLAGGLAVVGLTYIWRSGAEGVGEAVAGILYALPVLLLLAAVVAASFLYPPVTEASTEGEAVAVTAAPAEVVSGGGWAGFEPAEEGELAPRLYPLPIAAVYAAVRELAESRGWTIVGETPPPSLPVAAAPAGAPADTADEAGPFRGKRVLTQSRSEAMGAAVEPEAADPPPVEAAALQVVAKTPTFRFADDVTIRLEETPEGIRVDMRSASRIGSHDLGQNARRIRRFLADLDAAVQPELNTPTPAAPAEEATPVSIEPGPVSQ